MTPDVAEHFEKDSQLKLLAKDQQICKVDMERMNELELSLVDVTLSDNAM